MPANPSLDYSLPELRAAEARLRAIAQSLGISYSLAQYGGMRTQADTNQILNYRLADYRAAVKANPRVANIPLNTWRPIAPFGRSLHNWGAAFDIVITGVPQGRNASWALNALGAMAPQAGLRWGGTFPKATLDPPHFELPMSVVDARSAYLAFTQGKGYQGPKSPFDVFKSFFGMSSFPVPAPVRVQEAPQYMPAISYIQPRVEHIEMPRIEAAPLSPMRAPVVNADDQQEESRIIGTIGSSQRYGDSFGQPSMMLAGDEPTVSQVPTRTDASDAQLLANAQHAERQRDMKVIAGVIIVGLIVASSRSGRRR